MNFSINVLVPATKDYISNALRTVGISIFTSKKSKAIPVTGRGGL
jgi:hypothetical protein